MKTANKCPNCHKPVQAGDDVCQECGAVLAPDIRPAQPSANSAARGPGNGAACPNCAAPVALGADICEGCGVVLATARRAADYNQTAGPVGDDECPNCRHPRAEGTRFCRNCGQDFSGGPGTATPDPAPAANTLPGGTLLGGKYRIRKPIGTGGMGTVYLAEDEVLKRAVVLKALLRSDDAAMVAQAVKEREFLASLKHANIVGIYDFFTEGTEGYIVMEYVQGKTLYDLMEEAGGALPVPQAISYILAILPAFVYLAKLNLVYCDFKPQNVMLEQLKDGSRVVKLIDLGTVIKHSASPETIYGTAGYYAPEAMQTPAPRTDLYTICRSLALMVSCMDIDNPPFGMPPAEHFKAFRDYPVLYRLLVKGTHPVAARRFNSAEELADQLAGVLRLVQGGQPGVPVQSRLFAQAGATTGKIGMRGEATLDETDKAVDLLRGGDSALRAGDLKLAAKLYNQAMQHNANSLDAHLRLAEVAMESGQLPNALAEITAAQRRAPGLWKIAWYTGRLLEVQGNLGAAADQYHELMTDLPGELPPQIALARVRAQQGDHAAAVLLYSGINKADPSNVDIILHYTDSLLTLQRWDEAATLLGTVTDTAARYLDAQLLICDLFLRRVQPVTPDNLVRVAHALGNLAGRTEDPRYYLARADLYRLARDLVIGNTWTKGLELPGAADTHRDTLGRHAEAAYVAYLRRTDPPDRERIVRLRHSVAPWRIF
jgi:serine/threonine-protein kinase PknG